MRQIWDIHGGIHPPENKHQSLGEKIQTAGIPSQLILPLSQHIGAPAAPVVNVGDRVLKGQLIAEAKGFVSAPVHAPSSGTVVAIEPRIIPHPSGMTAPCVIIETDNKDEWIAHKGLSDYTGETKETLLDIIRNAGIAGMGGAGFPSAVKLAGHPSKPIDTLIINGTECEPYITADDILMRERAEQIIAGVKILQYIVQPSEQTLIGVEDNKPEGIAALQAAAAGSNIEIVVFPTKYPSGGEKQLIQILTGREVPSGGLPADIGIVCQNIGTAVAIHRAIEFGEPLISRITTVTGNACQQPRNYETLLGTPVQYLLDKSGFDSSRCSRLVMGGPMMGYTLEDTATPIVKTSNCVLAPTRDELPAPPPAQACIRCGMCAEACPVSLLPQQMYWFSRAQEHDKLEEHNLFDCIECGACSYACPSNIPLVQYYRASKAEIRQAQQDKAKADRSKVRFEARKERIEQEEAEKEAKRKARLEAAKAKQASAAAGDSKADAIQAAIERSKAKKAAQEGGNAPTENASPENLDPAQAAIARAQAKRAGGEVDETSEQKTERLEKQVASTEKRLTAAQQKLTLAQEQGDDKVAAFATAVEKTQAKLDSSRQELEAHLASLKSAAPAEPPQAELDPAQAAIARAMAAREAQANLSETDKLQQNVSSLETRIAKAEQKLAQAKEQGAETVGVLEDSLAKLQDKLADARQQLENHNLESQS
ncbi:electron transport complex subunit RsxC [Spongiibacter sp. KMU-158]|uniref:Ion-translocating oxidoreductase complex subunit C n=1 Tax=Spongiibacter pelagi TaxID=2760804 RepID=A0A927C1N2_9GAMM|nr:electron transport complex subunit RsxC [Spongiibacter pelagi]MBD2858382.1 electron transport complex subunit RsxC [Spongiibacter pelagi]